METIGQVNRYACRVCRAQTHTINMNSGTTPFGIRCPRCQSPESFSAMYSLGMPPGVTRIKVAVELAFYRPQPAEFEALDPERQRYVLGGAMLSKPLGQASPLPETEPPYRDWETLVAFMQRTYGATPRR